MKKIRVFGLFLSVVAIAAFLLACSNPAGPGSSRVDNIQRPTIPGGGDEGNNGGGGENNGGDNNVCGGNGLPPTSDLGWLRAVGEDVLEQLEWLRDYDGIRNGGYYYVVAGDNERPIPGSHNLGSVRESITVLIKSDDPANRRTLQLAEGNGAMLNVGAGNTLMLQDINLQGVQVFRNGAPLVNVRADGTLRMTDSEIKNNWSHGVRVSNGKFYMESGAVIRDNKGYRFGGGVQLNNSTLTMSGNAQISGNQAYVGSGNSARGGTGGGVFLQNSTLIMEDDAQISGNTASRITTPGLPGTGNGWHAGSGGGIAAMGNSVVNMLSNNVHVSGNVAFVGGGVYLDGSSDSFQFPGSATLNISGGCIQGRYASDGFEANTAITTDFWGNKVINDGASVFLVDGATAVAGNSAQVLETTNSTIIVSNNGNSVVLQP